MAMLLPEITAGGQGKAEITRWRGEKYRGSKESRAHTKKGDSQVGSQRKEKESSDPHTSSITATEGHLHAFLPPAPGSHCSSHRFKSFHTFQGSVQIMEELPWCPFPRSYRKELRFDSRKRKEKRGYSVLWGRRAGAGAECGDKGYFMEDSNCT